MPIYEFLCSNCDIIKEEMRKLGDVKPLNCSCGMKMERIFSPSVKIIADPEATQAKLKKRSDEQGKRFFRRAAYRVLKDKSKRMKSEV